MAAEFMLGLNPVAIVTFLKPPELEPVETDGDAAGVATGVAELPPLVAAGGVLLSNAVVAVEGSVADVDDPQAASTMLTQSIATINTDLRI